MCITSDGQWHTGNPVTNICVCRHGLCEKERAGRSVAVTITQLNIKTAAGSKV